MAASGLDPPTTAQPAPVASIRPTVARLARKGKGLRILAAPAAAAAVAVAGKREKGTILS